MRYDDAEVCLFFDVDGKSYSTVKVHTNSNFHTRNCWPFSIDFENLPTGAISQYIVCFSGLLWVHIVDVADLLDKGIPAGFSIFVPFGQLAIIDAVSLDDDNVVGSYFALTILEKRIDDEHNGKGPR